MKMVRSLFLAAVSLSASPLLAKAARVAEQPPSEFADTEAVTNVAIAVRDAERPRVGKRQDERERRKMRVSQPTPLLVPSAWCLVLGA